jgi:nucleoside phosphorylase
MMKLLTFAHRGEAQAFLSAFQFKPVDFFFDGLLKSQNFYLLITGEGVQSASEKTISTLARFNDEIVEVINLGVAGSVTEKLKKNDLIWIRTAYAHHAEKLEFKSFTSALPAHHDCMTAFSRVLDVNEKKKLSLFADIVDRELWAVASAAHLFKKPFRSLKIISDEMKNAESDICKFIKEEAALFSEKLLHEFQNYQGKAEVETKKEDKDFLEDNNFYFTVSQERKLQSTLDGLKLKGLDRSALYKSDEFVKNLKQEELLPKERTRLLLQNLTERLNPMAKKIRENIEDKLEPLKEARIHASYDNDFEEEWVNLSMRIQSSRDLERVKNALKIFSYEDFKKVLNGQFDV